MKLKLDLHPIYNDSRKIEESLQAIVDEAVRIRATLVEVIPGKGSGALKKTVLRFLDRAEVRTRYHRLEKDGDNWGRLFIHFRPEKPEGNSNPAQPATAVAYPCFCCGAACRVVADFEHEDAFVRTVECPSCGSPNKLVVRPTPAGGLHVAVSSGYGD